MRQSAKIRIKVSPNSGAYELSDKRTGVTWSSNPRQARLGTVGLSEGGAVRTLPLEHFTASARGEAIELTQALPGDSSSPLVVRLMILADGETGELACSSSDPRIRAVRLLDDALWITDADDGSVIVPVRLGMQILARSGKAFQRAFRTSGYEGCYCEMVGLTKRRSVVLVTWHDTDSVFHENQQRRQR